MISFDEFFEIVLQQKIIYDHRLLKDFSVELCIDDTYSIINTKENNNNIGAICLDLSTHQYEVIFTSFDYVVVNEKELNVLYYIIKTLNEFVRREKLLEQLVKDAQEDGSYF